MLALAWALAVALYLPFDHRGWQFNRSPSDIAFFGGCRAGLVWLALWWFSGTDRYGLPRDVGDVWVAIFGASLYLWWEGRRLGRARAAHLLLFIDGAAGQIEQWRYQDELDAERRAAASQQAL